MRYFVLAITIALQMNANTTTDQQLIRVSEIMLRESAKAKITPEYPSRSRRQRTVGVVVARIIADVNGNVSSVEILESPDSFISDATKAALLRWKFSPMTVSGKPVSISGKLIFYFIQQNDKYSVLSPAESYSGK